MSELMKLRQEHAKLIEIVGRLAKVIAQPQPPAASELFRLRHELSSTLIAHLKAEDWVLYPRLLDSPDAKVTETARAFAAASRKPTAPTRTNGPPTPSIATGAAIAKRRAGSSRRWWAASPAKTTSCIRWPRRSTRRREGSPADAARAQSAPSRA